ncbi:hypothetical protein [Parasitella parasitica]|uniref:Uncharacterized protein n=1 Tax=Parasitella parasitica TaxID=35722 RepID=A0A0B7MWN8_9FUNG|nr:hypothetical protein [Parasitella parasitica]
MAVFNKNETRVNKFLNGKELSVVITTTKSSFARGVITFQCKHGGFTEQPIKRRLSAASDDVAKRVISTSRSLCPMQIFGRRSKLDKVAINKSVDDHSYPLPRDVRAYTYIQHLERWILRF